MSVCFYHGDRPGVGLCVRCRKVICSACCTRLEGINHCHACLKALGSRREPSRGRSLPRSLTALVMAGLGWVFLLGLLWLSQGLLDR